MVKLEKKKKKKHNLLKHVSVANMEEGKRQMKTLSGLAEGEQYTLRCSWIIIPNLHLQL